MKMQTGVLGLLLFLLLSLPSFGNAAQEQSKASFQVPAEKKEKWRSFQNLVQKEYKVCKEHCGKSRQCLDRCEQVYRVRLEREYRNMMAE